MPLTQRGQEGLSQFVLKLICSKCGSRYEPTDHPVMCTKNDLGRLDIVYDLDAVSSRITKDTISTRGHDIWRYGELLPVKEKFAVKLGEGGTRLLRARRLGEKFGLKALYVKDETRNPTGSFKDRAMAVGVSHARQLGAGDLVTASSGNAASSLAAYASKASLRCHAFVLESASPAKIAQLTLYGASVTKVKGTGRGGDPTVRMMLEAHERYGWYPCPSFGPFNPYQVEGPKTITYEVIEQLGWIAPDWILIPTGSSCLLAGIWKGVRDMVSLGWISAPPKLSPVQPAGNSPLIKAIEKGLSFEQIRPEKSSKTVASGLSDPFPWDGDAGLRAVRETGGTGVGVTDTQILEAVRDLARYEGILAEPSGAAALAATKKLVQNGVVSSSDTLVVLITGSGLKDQEGVSKALRIS